jgi:hypothetical protein
MKKKFFYNAIPYVGPSPVNTFETVVIHRGLQQPVGPVVLLRSIVRRMSYATSKLSTETKTTA